MCSAAGKTISRSMGNRCSIPGRERDLFFMSTTGHIGYGAHLNVNYKGFWRVLLLLWLNYCKTLSIVWCFERNTVSRKPKRGHFSGEEILEHIKVRSYELLWITGRENEKNSTRSSHRKVLFLSDSRQGAETVIVKYCYLFNICLTVHR